MPEGKLIFPTTGIPPADPVISRFLAKIALEAMAHRLLDKPEGLDYLCDEDQLDPLRDHARRGKRPVWPVHSRRIYDPDSRAYDGDTDVGQTLHEFDFLVTSENEWYFVLAIFGLELTINLGGPNLPATSAGWRKTITPARCTRARMLFIACPALDATSERPNLIGLIGRLEAGHRRQKSAPGPRGVLV
jgi:hypothetical protein